MIMKGMYLGVDRTSCEKKLTENLKSIVSLYRNHFVGDTVSAADVETESLEDV